MEQVNELRDRFALDSAGGYVLGLGVQGVVVAIILPGGPADPKRFHGDKLEVGDTIIAVNGVDAAPANIDDLLSGCAEGGNPASEVIVRARKQATQASRAREIEVVFERGAAGAHMRFTNLAANLQDCLSLGIQTEVDVRLLHLLRTTHEQLLSAIQQTSRAEKTLFSHVSALEEAVEVCAQANVHGDEKEEMVIDEAEGKLKGSFRSREKHDLQAQVLKWQMRFAEMDKRLKDSQSVRLQNQELLALVDTLQSRCTNLTMKADHVAADNVALSQQLDLARKEWEQSLQETEQAKDAAEHASRSLSAIEQAMHQQNRKMQQLEGSTQPFARADSRSTHVIEQLMSENATTSGRLQGVQDEVNELRRQLQMKERDLKGALADAEDHRRTAAVMTRQMRQWESASRQEHQQHVLELQGLLEDARRETEELRELCKDRARLADEAKQQRLVIRDLKQHLGLEQDELGSPRDGSAGYKWKPGRRSQGAGMNGGVNPLSSLMASLVRPASSRTPTDTVQDTEKMACAGSGSTKEHLRDQIADLHEQVRDCMCGT